MERLDKDKKDAIQRQFLLELGRFLEKQRKKKNYSLTDTGAFLGIGKSSIHDYEAGLRIPADVLPLFSICYDFPMTDYFREGESIKVVETLRGAAEIITKAQKRRDQRTAQFSSKQLVRKVYEIDGQTVTEEVPVKSKKHTQSYRDQCLEGRMEVKYAVPFTAKEFAEYMETEYPDTVKELAGTGDLLRHLEKQEGKETLKEMLARYIVDELVVKRLMENKEDQKAQRAYAYYRDIMNGNTSASEASADDSSEKNDNDFLKDHDEK